MEDNLKDPRFAYPPDDGLPTPEQLAAIARIVPQDIELKVLYTLFDDHLVADLECDAQALLLPPTVDPALK